MISEVQNDAKTRMMKTTETLKHELAKLRTGRAHPSLLDHLTVMAYGVESPLSQVASIGVEDARTLSVQPWDKQLVPAIEKAIINSDLGLNPATAGTNIRIPMPALTEERRKDLIRVVKAEGENSKVAIRNIRRDANNQIRDLVKTKQISEDEERRGVDAIQKITDASIAEVDKQLATKEDDLMSV